VREYSRVSIPVVGAAIVRGGRVLAARRCEPVRFAGGWEFPGGKVEAGESDTEALVRECEEELGVTVAVGARLGTSADGPIELTLYAATLLVGDPQPLQDHDELRWLAAGQLDDVAWLPIDLVLLPAVAAALRTNLV
jgi:8-oxo-dGTP diphosphatase